jgi:hypothetical protein
MTEPMTMGDARTRYYETNGFGADGGDSLRWVPIKILGITIYIPNTDARRRAVRIHDLHHVVTGYGTDLRGEGEIGAWELASGCARCPVAFVINLFALGIGTAIAPRRTARAWARGRRTRNLYGERNGIDHLLPRYVDEIRASLRLDRPAPPVRARDALAVAAGGLAMIGVMAALAASPLVGAAVLIAALA